MAVCSFIGHRDVYDADIISRMQAAIDQLTAESETVEFLVYTCDVFSCVFLLAAMRARTKYPKKVTITFVTRHTTEQMNREEKSYYYVSDKLVMPDIHPLEDAPALKHKRMLQWIIQRSTHVISYFYDTLHESRNHLVTSPKAQEIRLTSADTETAILKAALLMKEKEQIVYQKMNEGCTLKEAGKAIGVSGERARQILQYGCRTIREELTRRYSRALAAERGRERTCGLFALGEATYDSLTCFKRIIVFLLCRYNASDIYVEQSYVHSGFLFALNCIRLHEMHITALVGGGALSEDAGEMDTIKAALCPPCHAVGYTSSADSENNADDFEVIADMIERLDFCVCNLSATPYAEKIREYAAQTKRGVLLDISRFSNSGSVAQEQERAYEQIS